MKLAVTDGVAIIPQERYDELIEAEVKLDVVKDIVRSNRPCALDTIADLFCIERKKRPVAPAGESDGR